MQEQNGKLSTELTEIKTKLDEASIQVRSKTEEFDTLSSRFAKIKTEFIDKLKKGRATTTAVREQLEQANAQIASLKNTKTQESAELNTIKNELAHSKSELEAVKKERDNLKSSLNSSNQTSAKTISQLKAQIENHDASSNNKNNTAVSNEELNSLKQELSASKESLKLAENEVTSLKGKLGNGSSTDKLTEDISNKDKRIKTLEEEVNKLSDQVLDLQQNNTQSGTGENETIKKQQSEIQSLQDKNKHLTGKIEEITKLNGSSVPLAEHENQISKLKAEIQNQISQSRIAAKKQSDEEYQIKLKEMKEDAQKKVRTVIQDQKRAMEDELKEKQKQLEAALQNTHANSNNGGKSAPNEGALNKLKEKYEEQIKKLKEEAAEDKKKTREMTLAESQMRIRLLQSKADKAEKERLSLADQLSTLRQSQPSTVAAAANPQQPAQDKAEQDLLPGAVPHIANAQTSKPSNNGAIGGFSFPTSSQSHLPTMPRGGSQGSRLPTRAGFGRGRSNRGGNFTHMNNPNQHHIQIGGDNNSSNTISLAGNIDTDNSNNNNTNNNVQTHPNTSIPAASAGLKRPMDSAVNGQQEQKRRKDGDESSGANESTDSKVSNS